MPRKTRIRSDFFDFRFTDPSWFEKAAGRAAAVWTRWDAPRFGGPFERAADLRLWLVREAGGRPILACLQPRVDDAGVVALGADDVQGAWDLSLRDRSPASLRADDSPLGDLARRVADMIARRRPSAPAAAPPIPRTYLGYAARVRPRRSAEFAARLARAFGGDPAPSQVREAWEGVPAVLRIPGRRDRFLYPVEYLSSSAEGAPGAIDVEGGRPLRPPGGAAVYAATARLGGLEAPNPALEIYKRFGLLGPRDRRDDRARVDAAAARLADAAEFTPGDRLALCEAMRGRLSALVAYAPADLMAALLDPLRPIVASTQPRPAWFPAAELENLHRRGWDLEGLAAPAPAGAAELGPGEGADAARLAVAS
ncbi:hypothetical protein [Paludisphaera mucosa]|uniref:Uncharacterized protein n=1 Tax=Paludisphaera mucosa TaxID=3030827 RepID=A0ABT6FLA5_9BACT|nr:hypothetical protein [Paludisphaera mucosa]MDG3008304.1 hypothetical protein [Paludisphaera mucosa]